MIVTHSRRYVNKVGVLLFTLASWPHRKARRTQRLTTWYQGVSASEIREERGRVMMSRWRMRLQPVFQGIIHACLPAFSSGFEGRDDLRVVAHRQGLFGALRLGAATGKRLTQHSRAFWGRYWLLTDFPLALLEEILRQFRRVVWINVNQRPIVSRCQRPNLSSLSG